MSQDHLHFQEGVDPLQTTAENGGPMSPSSSSGYSDGLSPSIGPVTTQSTSIRAHGSTSSITSRIQESESSESKTDMHLEPLNDIPSVAGDLFMEDGRVKIPQTQEQWIRFLAAYTTSNIRQKSELFRLNPDELESHDARVQNQYPEQSTSHGSSPEPAPTQLGLRDTSVEEEARLTGFHPKDHSTDDDHYEDAGDDNVGTQAEVGSTGRAAVEVHSLNPYGAETNQWCETHAGENQDPDIPNMSLEDAEKEKEEIASRQTHRRKIQFNVQNRSRQALAEGLGQTQVPTVRMGDLSLADRNVLREDQALSNSFQPRPPNHISSPQSAEPAEGSKTPQGSHRGPSGSARIPILSQSSSKPQSSTKHSSADRSTHPTSSIQSSIPIEAEAERIRSFFDSHRFLTAPRLSSTELRRRLRILRRLGVDRPDSDGHKSTLDRFTRLASSFFRVKNASVAFVGKHKILFPSQIGLDSTEGDRNLAICPHSCLRLGPCMVVEDLALDWRFRLHPMVDKGKGPLRFYASCPLALGGGKKSITLGSMTLYDDKPRHDFDEHARQVLTDLAASVNSELEMLIQESGLLARQKMHQVTVDFLRQSLQSAAPRPTPASRSLKKSKRGQGDKKANGNDFGNPSPDSLYSEACNVMRGTLGATAVAIVDLSRFHVYWPSFSRGTSAAGESYDTGSRTERTGLPSESLITPSRAGYDQASSRSAGQSSLPDRKSSSGNSHSSSGEYSVGSDPDNPYGKEKNGTKARPLVNTSSQVLPRVEYIADRDATETAGSVKNRQKAIDLVKILGVSQSSDDEIFQFNSPEAKRIISEFIQLNLAHRKVWYERDESAAVASSINVLMPRGTQVSLALPVFDFQGQPTFCATICWTDEVYSYDQSVIAFVELEKSQRAFAALTNHEVRTPMHQILSTTNLLRLALLGEASEEHAAGASKTTQALFERISNSCNKEEVEGLLQILESSSHTLETILNDVLDYLDITGEHGMPGSSSSISAATNLQMEDIATGAIRDAFEREDRDRAACGKSFANVEVTLELLPRSTGSWSLLVDGKALERAIYKLCLNAFQATESGFVKVVCEDVSHYTPAGYDSGSSTSLISIQITDSGKGMPQEFADGEIFEPFKKADPFSPGTGLGVTLAQRTIALLGGNISYSTKEGEGTLCVVEVPLTFEELDEERDEANADEDADDHEDGLSDNGSSEELEVTNQAIILLGFPQDESRLSKADIGLLEVKNSIIRQLQALECKVTEDLSAASVLVVEEQYNLLNHHPELAERGGQDLRIIMLGAAPILSCNANRPRFLSWDDRKIDVEWMFRPVYPKLAERIASASNALLLPSPQPSLSGSPRLSPLPNSKLLTPPLGFPGGLDQDQSSEAPATPQIATQSDDDFPEKTKPVTGSADIETKAPERPTAAERGPASASHRGATTPTESPRSPFRVLLDINMPRKDGFETAAAIREHEHNDNLPRCKIVAVTALGIESERRRGLVDSDIDEWLTKPVTIRTIRSDIEVMLNRVRRGSPAPSRRRQSRSTEA